MYKIMIVEDDPTISGALKRLLLKYGYTPVVTDDFQNVMKTFSISSPHLVLMDIGLPFFDGYHWCSEIRKTSHTPVLFLSSAADNMNLIMALSLGADDFLCKPFDSNVLVAKIAALLRRAYTFSDTLDVLQCHGAILDLKSASLSYHGAKLELTKNEFRILSLLFEHRGHTVTREEMMQALWQSDCFIDDNTLTVNVTRLRRRLSDIGLSTLIRTQKGLGYIVEDNHE
ncbi:response regulator transcription factor [uncultured Ruthenibacterium sp.]|uniref:response regulator transcription factor n=1 Tax=uncultured Ruthenibacterium sp. TaxID=1905347 RepID=UPI00349E9206